MIAERFRLTGKVQGEKYAPRAKVRCSEAVDLAIAGGSPSGNPRRQAWGDAKLRCLSPRTALRMLCKTLPPCRYAGRATVRHQSAVAENVGPSRHRHTAVRRPDTHRSFTLQPRGIVLSHERTLPSQALRASTLQAYMDYQRQRQMTLGDLLLENRDRLSPGGDL